MIIVRNFGTGPKSSVSDKIRVGPCSTGESQRVFSFCVVLTGYDSCLILAPFRHASKQVGVLVHGIDMKVNQSKKEANFITRLAAFSTK